MIPLMPGAVVWADLGDGVGREQSGRRPVVVICHAWGGRDEFVEQKARLGEVFAASERVRKLVEMREELAALWERSTLSRDQLLEKLQQWLARAEASGQVPLQELALRVRRYAA